MKTSTQKKITRRAALGALAATAAFPASSFATAVSDDWAPSRLAELIAGFREAQAIEEKAWARVGAIESMLELPAVRVSGGRMIGIGDYWLHTPTEIDQHFDRISSLTFPENVRSASNAARAKAHRELSDLAAAVHRYREDSGFNAAEAEHEAAQDRMCDARWTILEYVPMSLDEFRERDAFIHEQLRAGVEFDDEQLKAIFAA